MYVGLKQPLGDGERCVTPARAAAKETRAGEAQQKILSRKSVPGGRRTKTGQKYEGPKGGL